MPAYQPKPKDEPVDLVKKPIDAAKKLEEPVHDAREEAPVSAPKAPGAAAAEEPENESEP